MGLFSLSIGIGEITADVLVMFVADKFDFERLILVASTLCTLFYLTLTGLHFRGELYSGAVVLFMLFMSFEFATVVTITRAPLVCPQAGHIFMALFFSAIACGYFLGALVATPVFDMNGFLSTCAFSSGISSYVYAHI
jgi:predicted MFS family arabinose efflux permease